MTAPEKNHRTIQRFISRTRAAWRVNETLFGLFAAVSVAATACAAGAAVDAGWKFRLVLLAAAAVGSLYFLIRHVFFPLARRITDEDVAVAVETARPDLRQKLISAVQLWNGYKTGDGDFSREMFEALLDETAVVVAAMKPIDFARRRKTFVALAAALFAGIVLALSLRGADGGIDAARRFVSPPYMPRREYFRLTRVTGDVRAPRGAAAVVEAEFIGYMRGAPSIELERETLEPVKIGMKTVRSAAGRYSFKTKIAKIDDDVSYRVRYRGFSSKPFRITAVDAPAIRRMSMSMAYPRHTGIPREEIDDAGDIRAPYGSIAGIVVESTRDMTAAWLTFDGGKRLRMKPAGKRKAAASFTIGKSGSYSVHLKGELGMTNPTPPVFSIASIPDAPPSIAILSPAGDLRQARAQMVHIKAAAEDDYLVSSMKLVYEVTGSGKRGSITLPADPARSIDFEFLWGLDKTPAYEGDTVVFHLEAVDNDALTGPKTARSESRRLIIVSEEEDFKDIEEEQREVLEEMESAIRDGTNISERFESLRMEIGKGKLDRKDYSDFERTLQRQAELEDEVAEITTSLDESIERMKENSLIGASTLDKMMQMSELMDSVMSEEMKETLKGIQEKLKDMPLPSLDKLAMERMLDQDKINRSLEMALTRLKRIKAEQDLRALGEQMRRLVEEQREVIEKTEALQKGGKPLTGREKQEAERLAREEERIAHKIGEIDREMNKVKQRVGEFDPEMSRQLGEQMEKASADAIKKQLKSAENSLEKGDPGKAEQHERDALEGMTSLAEAMGAFSSDFMEGMNSAAEKKILEAIEKTINLSERHEEFLADVESRRNDPPASVYGEKGGPLAVEGGFIENVAGGLLLELNILAQHTLAVKSQTLETAFSVSIKLREMLAALETGDFYTGWTRSREAYLGLNRIAIDLLDAKAQMAQMSAEGDMEEYLQRLEQFAQSQMDLNQMFEDMNSMGLPIPSMAGALRDMAMQQALIREGVGKLLREMSNVGEIQQRLDQIEQEMEAIEKMMGEMKIDGGMERRQANVLRRLQDATLSLKKEFFDQKRVAERAKDYGITRPGQLIIRGGDALPGEILREMNYFRAGEAPEGFETPVKKYYEELMN